jgi:hypothetical protein
MLLDSLSDTVLPLVKTPTVIQAVLLPAESVAPAAHTVSPQANKPKFNKRASNRNKSGPVAKQSQHSITDQSLALADGNNEAPIYYDDPNIDNEKEKPSETPPVAEPQNLIQEPLSLTGPDAIAPNVSAVLVFDVFLSEQEAPVARQVHEVNINSKRYSIKTRGEAVGLMSLFYSGLLTQSSEGTTAKDGFHPEKYTEQRGKKPETSAVINWQTGYISFVDSEPRPTARIDSGLQDRLTMAYQLGALAWAIVDSGRTLQTDQIFNMPIATTREVERIGFKLIGKEVISIGNTSDSTWHFAKVVKKPQEDSQIDIWISPAKAWMPIQIRIRDKKGMSFVQKLNTEGL